ncbi:sce7725 family protein [Algoriphagus sp.]|uniref:sce7725 family protein n=1 Tax=Algoriphagus sp. TaxID=1872435 RepID=UPI003F6E4859
MYFPFLRGKQYELIALRELVSLPLNPSLVSPIVEPIKKNLNTITTAAKALKTIGVKMQLIVNPQYGELKNKTEAILEYIAFQDTSEGIDNLIPSFIIQNQADFLNFRNFRSSSSWKNSGFSLIHLKQIAETEELVSLLAGAEVNANIIHVNQMLTLRRKFRGASSALLSDPFNKQRRNKDYADYADEFFSNDYRYYREEGYSGFGDYLTIGEEYIEGGGLPYAVVLHLTYLDTETGDIRIRHFLSDSNDDTSDTPGKFYEALDKLIAFVIQRQISETIAISKFKEIYENQSYPGLGVIKKLSMMHHLELIQTVMG